MYSGLPPFEKAVVDDPFFKLIKQKEFRLFWKSHERKKTPGYYSRSFKDLFVRMVAFEPAERITIEKIAEHAWVTQPICSHTEITIEFGKRQKRMETSMRNKREEIEKERGKKTTAVSTWEEHGTGK
jgi:serine/threonine protein kinase